MSVPPIATQPVYSNDATRTYTGGSDSYIDAGNPAALDLSDGTISLSFSVDNTLARYALVSKDSRGRDEGEFTVWVDEGELKVSFEESGRTENLTAQDVTLEAGVEYHFALSFGSGGLQLWLNGAMVAAEPEFKHGIDGTDADFLIGGTRTWTDSTDKADAVFRGEIGNVHVYDRQLFEGDMFALAADVDPSLDDAARMDRAMESLAPVLEQTHHGSNTLQEILEDYGVSGGGHDDHGGGHGDMSLMMMTGNNAGNTMTGTAMADGINGMRGADDIDGGAGDDILQGEYGNDTLNGGAGNDILDGGHGEDILNGGDGDDLLIARSDGREPVIAQDPGYAPDQLIPANDVLTGGAGSDIFYIQTLINARREYIEEHTNDDGTINWHGVAGENDNPHDHWVDHGGHDVITDFSRAEGDRIVIEGHTTEIYGIEYGDSNGDGVMDHSIITLYSQQGNNGGAHDEDQLGTVTVYGDLVRMSDIEHTAAPAYGIVATSLDLGEALSPFEEGSSQGPIAAPTDVSNTGDFATLDGEAPVFGAAGEFDFLPELRAPLIFDHSANLELDAGTISMTFNVTNLRDGMFLFTKDASGMDDPGHVSAYINAEGDLTLRIQDGDKSHYLTAQGAVETGTDYEMAYSFGPDGAQVFLNGVRVANKSSLTVSLADNPEALIVGASGWSSTPGTTDSIWGHFDGTISDFAIYDAQVTGTTAPSLAPPPSSEAPEPEPETPVAEPETPNTDTSVDGEVMTYAAGNDQMTGTAGDDTMSGGAGFDTLNGGEGDDILNGEDHADLLLGGAGDDLVNGGDGLDNLFGDAGNDTIEAGAGNDRLFGGADDDVLNGDAGNDYVFGDDGNDVATGGTGFDLLDGGAGDDQLSGGDQADNLFGGQGNDTLNGDNGFDRLFGGEGDDVGYGGEGTDALFGQEGNDTLHGGTEDDRFFGGTGNDLLNGEADDDQLFGGAGFDIIVGGTGNDTMAGDFNADTFRFDDGFGADVILDFDALNALEQIDLSGVTAITDMTDLADNHMTQSGSNVEIDAGAGNTITLLNVSLGDLDATDFVF